MWLFDLENDPTEQNNLADQRADKVAELQNMLDEHQANSVPPLYDYEMESPQPIDITGAEIASAKDEYVWVPN